MERKNIEIRKTKLKTQKKTHNRQNIQYITNLLYIVSYIQKRK